MKKITYLILLVLICSGCATKRVMFLKDPKLTKITVDDESVILMTITTDNWNAPKHIPKVLGGNVWSIDIPKTKKYYWKIIEKAFDTYKDISTEYLVGVKMPAGQYKLRELTAMSSSLLSNGVFIAPVYSNFTLEPNEIVYIGHIEAIVVKRTEDEQLRAGPVIPLIDQSIAGASSGTFNITISDDYENDIAKFLKEYPLLEGKDINKRVMENWTQPSKEEMKPKNNNL
ncbi:MAG: hypothetical protein KC733_11080 [Candidatus Omnitrophica bacterium]|nr:hypothetical protein [Candidatus Omnitrophota bacterium]